MHSFSLTIFFTIFIFLYPSSAFAYIDPGSGILLWQGLIAGLGVVLVFIRKIINFFKELFKIEDKK